MELLGKMVKEIFTYSDIILYWDIQDKKSKDEQYYVYFNGKLINKSHKTHVTIRNIIDKSADVEIYTDDARKVLFYKKSFTMKEKPHFIDVTAEPYSAIGDGKTINTIAIQRAIDDCKENEAVFIPKGVYLTGALFLHSDMELYIDDDAILQGTENPNDYLPKIWTRYEGIERECYSSMLNIGNINNRNEISCKNILIHGGGKILGGGRQLAENVVSVEKERLKDYIDSLAREEISSINEKVIAGRSRPRLINVSCAENIVMDNVEFGNGACWNIHMIYSKNVTTCNCSIYSLNVWNGDGWNPDSSTDCTLFNCDFCTGDDCVAIKSGKNPEGNTIAKPCSNIRVFDCRSENGHGISIGSEISGGISDVYIWDCIINKSQIGCNIKATKKRGGYIKNIHISNCCFASLNIGLVPYNDDGISAPSAPYFSEIYFENITFRGEVLAYSKQEINKTTAINITGFDDEHKISNVQFKNILIDNGHSSESQIFRLQSVENLSIINLNAR
jgi:polygalacturonase